MKQEKSSDDCNVKTERRHSKASSCQPTKEWEMRRKHKHLTLSATHAAVARWSDDRFRCIFCLAANQGNDKLKFFNSCSLLWRGENNLTISSCMKYLWVRLTLCRSLGWTFVFTNNWIMRSLAKCSFYFLSLPSIKIHIIFRQRFDFAPRWIGWSAFAKAT